MCSPDLHFPSHWGTWGPRQLCPDRFDFAVAYRIKVEAYQGGLAWEDDSGLNAVELRCESGATLTSAVGNWGDWGAYSSACATGLTGADARMEGQQVCAN